MKIMFIVIAFVLSCSAYSAEGRFRNEVIPSFEIAFTKVKKSPLPPPKFAHIMALAFECGERTSIHNYKKPFTLAFLMTLEKLEPKWLGVVNEGIKSGVLPRENLAEAINVITSNERIWLSQKINSIELASISKNTSGVTDGEWRPTAPSYSAPLLPHWGLILDLSDKGYAATAKGLTPPHVYSPVYYNELDEVLMDGDKNIWNPEMKKIALFWAAGAGSLTPPGMWLEAGLIAISASVYSDSEKISIMKSLTTALNYAGIMAWKVKFQFNTWRPLTAIRKSGLDLAWNPRLETPPFPSYVSGHSTFSAAAAVVLNSYNLNELNFKDEKGNRKTFSSAWKAALEAGKSRIYGGIHFEADNRDGLELGKRIACKTLSRSSISCE